MNTLELKPGDKIGVFFYDDKRGTKAVFELNFYLNKKSTLMINLTNK
jgi:hypothetical protein